MKQQIRLVATLWSLLIILTIMCLVARAQSEGTDVPKNFGAPDQPSTAMSGKLNIGDTIPEYLWHLPLQVVNHPQGKETITLNDSRGKLIILDFWATWCAACIAMFPKMDSLQMSYAEKVQFLSVTDQHPKVAVPFLEKFEQKQGKKSAVPAVLDNELHTFFPHRILPHYVWINGQGRVMGITELTEVSASKIDAVLSGESGVLTPKVDIAAPDYDPQKPMMGQRGIVNTDNLIQSSLLTTYIPGLTSGYDVSADSMGNRRVTARNVNLYWLYRLSHWDNPVFNRDEIIFASKDSLQFNSDKFGQEYLDWLANGHGFCYERIVPEHLSGELFSIMRRDLEILFPQYTAELTDETRKCWAIKVADPHAAPPGESAGGEPSIVIDPFGCQMQNQPLSALTARLNFYNYGGKFPFVDRTGITYPIDLDLSPAKWTIQGINEQLKPYNLKIEEETERVDVITISDTQSNHQPL